jgi:membrane-associated phospholipid phosphatase
VSFFRAFRGLLLASTFTIKPALAQIPAQYEPPAPPAPVSPPDAIADPPVAAPTTPPPLISPPTPRAVVVEPAPTVAPRSEHRLVWKYARFRWWEYVAAGAVTVGNLSMEALYQSQPAQSWHEPVLFDGAVRGWLKADTKDWERHATYIADYTWYATQWYVLADSIVTPLVSDKLNADVAFQLTLLNWQAVGLTGLLARVTHVTIGRTRPSLQGCSDDPEAENRCEFRGASFLSGHAAMTTASAGVGCMNHAYLPLYGGGVADALVCPVLLTGAATVGVLRIVTDKHWISDVIAGWALGGVIGFGLPYALHYSPSAVRSALQPRPNMAFIPWADSSSGGLQLVGLL